MADLKPGWRRVKFGEVVRLVKETCNDPVADGIERVIGLEHIEPGELRIRSWNNVADGTTFTTRVRAGQVLFGKRRAYQRKVAVADFDAICSGDIYVFESANPERLLSELLPFLCQTDAFFDHAVGTSAGSLSPRTNWSSMSEYEFALPPPEEQAQHARLLAASTALQDATRALRGRLDSVVASFMQESLTAASAETTQYCRDLIRAGMLSFQTGPFGTVLNASAYKESGHPVINPVDIADGRIEVERAVRIGDEDWARLEKYWLKPGDILLGRKRHMHKLVIIGPEHDGYVVGSDCIRLRVEQSRIDPRYFYYVLRSDATQHWLQAQAGGNGTVMPGMNEVILGRLKVFLPDLEAQRRIVLELDRLVGAAAALRVRQSHGANLHKRLLEASIG